MKRYWIFLSIIGIAIAAVYVLREGYYPIAMVGNTLVSARDFSRQFEAARAYSRKVQTVYGVSSTLPTADLEESVLEGMIERVLVHAQVEKEIGTETSRVVADRADAFLKDPELVTAAEAVYEVSEEEFRRMVLVPQAEREILTGKLFLRGIGFADWLLKAKQDERVLLIIPGFRWDRGELTKGNP